MLFDSSWPRLAVTKDVFGSALYFIDPSPMTQKLSFGSTASACPNDAKFKEPLLYENIRTGKTSARYRNIY